MSWLTDRYGEESLTNLRADFTLCDRAFVYGSLKDGEWNNVLLADSELLTKTHTKDKFVLGDVGYPYAFRKDIVPTEYKSLLFPVLGEVFKMESLTTMCSLDGLEGYPTHYNRRIVKTDSGMTAWMYMNERWGDAHRCNACNVTEGKWIWRS